MSNVMISTSIETKSGIFIDITNPKPEQILLDDIFWVLARMPRFGGHSNCEEVYTVAQHLVLTANLVSWLLFDTEAVSMDIDGYDSPTVALLNYPRVHIDQAGVDHKTDIGKRLQTSFINYLRKKDPDNVSVRLDEVSDLANKPMQALRCVIQALRHDWGEAYLIDLPTPIKRYGQLRAEYEKLETGVMKAIDEAHPLLRAEHHPIMDLIVKWADDQALAIEANLFIPSGGRGWMIYTKPVQANVFLDMEPLNQQLARFLLVRLHRELMRQYYAG
jgi:hypothetical protein